MGSAAATLQAMKRFGAGSKSCKNLKPGCHCWHQAEVYGKALPSTLARTSRWRAYIINNTNPKLAVRDLNPKAQHSYASPRSKRNAFSAIMTVGACVLPETMVGMMEQSTTLKPSRPCTFRHGSTTAVGSLFGPILHVPAG